MEGQPEERKTTLKQATNKGKCATAVQCYCWCGAAYRHSTRHSRQHGKLVHTHTSAVDTLQPP